MKKIKSLFCMLILSTCISSNAFAGDFTGNGIASFVDNFVNAIVSLVTKDDNCEGRICTNCKPQSDGGGTCRPPA